MDYFPEIHFHNMNDILKISRIGLKMGPICDQIKKKKTLKVWDFHNILVSAETLKIKTFLEYLGNFE